MDATTASPPSSSSSGPIFTALRYVLFFIAASYTVEAVCTWRWIRKQSQYPVVGGYLLLLPKFFLNFIHAWKLTDLIRAGYEKHGGSPFQLVRSEGSMLVLPPSLLDELSHLPSSIANGSDALERDLVGSFTGVDLIIKSRLHHLIVQRKVTPRLPLLMPRIEAAVSAAFEQHMPQSQEWTQFEPYQAWKHVSARLSAEVIVGPTWCDNAEWLHIAVEYTENLFRTCVILRCFPLWMRPLLSRLLPSYWNGRRLLDKAKKLLGPQIGELLQKNDAGTWQPCDDNPDHLNVLSWLCGLAKGRDRSANVIAHLLVLLALASVHTTLLRMVNVLYDVVNDDESRLREDLLDEIEGVAARGWHDTGNPYHQLEKLDSVLRESQRLSPPTTLGMKRLFSQSHTFHDSTHVAKGTYVCMPAYAIENDPAHITSPEKFNGLRPYQAMRNDTDELLFSSPGPHSLQFGHGKTACPGRFFASVALKTVLVKAFTDYEFRFLPGQGRPKNIMIHEFLFTWPWTKMLVRKKAKPSCPF